MREEEMKKILQEFDQVPLPKKETIMAACEEAFESKNTKKTERIFSKPVFVKRRVLRVVALAACLCLVVTGVFGGVGLLKDRFSDATAPITQHTPDLPLDNYPPDEVDYANMGMVEYMELHPDFLSYRYMPWYEGYAFAHFEVLEAKQEYATKVVVEARKAESKPIAYSRLLIKCRVVADAWNVLEEGSEIYFYMSDRNDGAFFAELDAFLLRMPAICKYEDFMDKNDNLVRAAKIDIEIENLGTFPIVDGKIQTEKLESHLKSIEKPLNYEGSSFCHVSPDSVICEFSDVERIVGNGMDAATAVENLRDVYEKYQTGEYNHTISVEVLSELSYGEYCRMMDGTLTIEDCAKHSIMVPITYANLPPLVSVELSLSDGTKFEFCTRAAISEKWMKKLVEEDIPRLELEHTDENGKLNQEACIKSIKGREFDYCWKTYFGADPEDFN